MNNKTVTVIAIAALAFLYFQARGAGVKKPGKKKLKPVIIPLPLQNITEQEFYGTKAEFKAGQVADSSQSPGSALSVPNAAGLIKATNVTSDISAMPISAELKKALAPGRCN